MQKNTLIFRLLQFATAFVFLGQAWQHYFFSGPYRSLLWDENRFSWIEKHVFGQEWAVWTTNLAVDSGVVLYSKILSLLFLFCTILVFFVSKKRILSSIVIKLGVFFLIILAFINWQDHFFIPAQLFEYSIQLSVPIFLLSWVSLGAERLPAFFFWLRLMVAFSFVSHGLFAVGFYPTPGSFIEMSMSILGIDENSSLVFLKLMGILDFIAAVLIFVPFSSAIRAGLFYCIVWGTLTALARPIAYYYPEFWAESLHQWVYQAVLRLPHGLLPLAGWLIFSQLEKRQSHQMPK